VNRHYRPDYSQPFRINVTPKEAQWRYLSFRVLALEPGQTQELETADSEIVVASVASLIGSGHSGASPHQRGSAQPSNAPALHRGVNFERRT
jgi:5-deoxy-D-glucuronate isomerase